MAKSPAKVSAVNQSGLQDDHDPHDIGQRIFQRQEEKRSVVMSEQNHPEKRPGPFAQDRSRTPPTKEQREQTICRRKRKPARLLKSRVKVSRAFPFA
jgi:hypothetical protein